MSRPVRIKTMRTQIRDLEFDTPPALHGAVTISRGWEALQSSNLIPAIPVTDDDGGLFGMLSPSDVAAYDMRLSQNRIWSKFLCLTC